jgi:BON domain
MRISGRQRYGNVIFAGIAAAVLGLAVLPCASFAQSSTTTEGSEVAARVKQALESDQALDSRHIDVSVEHGQVVLKGFVQDNRALLDASRVATKAAGDQKLVNQLTIRQNYPNAP